MSDLTPEFLPVALKPLSLQAAAPQLDEELLSVLFALLREQGVTCAELARAVVDSLARSKFFPAPAELLERVRANRQAAFMADLEAKREERERDRTESFVRIDASQAERHYDVPSNYPPATGPPLDPKPAKYTAKGPVRDVHGQPDPFWPELPDRMPAWKRKMRYDHGFTSWQQATAPTVEAARRAPGPKQTKTTGPRPMFR